MQDKQDNENTEKSRNYIKYAVIVLICLVVILVFLIASGTAGFFVAKARVKLDQTLNHVERDYNSKLSAVDLSGIKVKSDNDIVNILLLGNDRRDEKYYSNSRGLTDVIMVATMDRKHGVLKLSSIMRDLRVYIPEAGGYGKINAAANYEGGVKSLYKTLAQNFNIKLDGYVQVDFDAFKAVVDGLGGVEVELTDTEMRYLSITNYIKKKKYRKGLKTGKQVFNGEQALGYCRIRKGKDMIGEPVVTVNGLIDDYGRTWRQRTVIKGVFNKIKKFSMSKWVDLANEVLGEYVKTDLTNDDIFDYMKDAIWMGTLEISQLQIPLNGYFRSSYDGEFSCGDSLVLTNGTTSDRSQSSNAEALSKFIFEYDGKEPFTYGTYTSDPTGASEE